MWLSWGSRFLHLLGEELHACGSAEIKPGLPPRSSQTNKVAVCLCSQFLNAQNQVQALLQGTQCPSSCGLAAVSVHLWPLALFSPPAHSPLQPLNTWELPTSPPWSKHALPCYWKGETTPHPSSLTPSPSPCCRLREAFFDGLPPLVRLIMVPTVVFLLLVCLWLGYEVFEGRSHPFCAWLRVGAWEIVEGMTEGRSDSAAVLPESSLRHCPKAVVGEGNSPFLFFFSLSFRIHYFENCHLKHNDPKKWFVYTFWVS